MPPFQKRKEKKPLPVSYFPICFKPERKGDLRWPVDFAGSFNVNLGKRESGNVPVGREKKRQPFWSNYLPRYYSLGYGMYVSLEPGIRHAII